VLSIIRQYLPARVCDGTFVRKLSLDFRPAELALSADRELLHVAGPDRVATFSTANLSLVSTWRPPPPEPSDVGVCAMALLADGERAGLYGLCCDVLCGACLCGG
jgi:hypothetical protein